MTNKTNKTKAKHTPGPWEAEFRTEQPSSHSPMGYNIFLIRNSLGRSSDGRECFGGIAENRNWAHKDGWEGAKANARLLAAAPTLLAALVECVEVMQSQGYVPPCIDRARAAIALATGQSK